MNTQTKLLCIALISMGQAYAASTSLNDVPMAITNLVKPNIMFMIDRSGSMYNIVPDTPYDPNTTYLASCPSGNTYPGGVATATTVDTSGNSYLRAAFNNGTVRIFNPDWSQPDYVYGTGSGQYCFNPALYYYARLYADTCNTSYCYVNSYGGGSIYNGNYLNWYFGASPNYTSEANFGTGAFRAKPGTKYRLQITQAAAASVISSLDRVRAGLFAYNGNDGGTLLETIDDLTSTKSASLISKINALTPSTNTPIGETLADIGKYYVTGYTGNLKIHPGQTGEANVSVSSLFPHDYNNGSGVSSPPAPIQLWCQRSFSILMTDGLPTEDTDTSIISSYLRNYYDGVPYLDDIAKALYEIDLRPDLVPPTGTKSGKNNAPTYTIGLADLQVLNNPLMSSTATQGGGLFLTANNATELTNAFNKATEDILAKDGSSAAVAVANANVTSGDNASYVSSYNSGNWSGDLIAYPIDVTTGVPNVNTPIWNTGCNNPDALVDTTDASKGKQGCSAQVKLDQSGAANPPTSPIAASARKIATYKGSGCFAGPASTTGCTSLVGLQFQPYAATPASGTTTLTSSLQTNLQTTSTTDGADVVNYLRGDQTKEGSAGNYRSRAHRLGDIVNAEPVIMREPYYGYSDDCYATAISGECTTAFKAAKATRARMVFQPGNDGMLHAFKAADGVEAWAYIPHLLVKEASSNLLNNLSKKSFSHKFLIDATPVLGDVDFSNTDGITGNPHPDWRTTIIGGLGKGGRGYYALDITCPLGATVSTTGTCTETLTEADVASKVLWEFPASASGSTVNSTCTSTNNIAIANLVGYSYGRPILVKTEAKGWVALVSSGYNNGTDTSGDGCGYLFVLNARTGALIKAIGTPSGSAASPSGLAQISAYVDNTNLDNTVKYVYSGDLNGNVWRFNLGGNSTSAWSVTKVATLNNASGTAQPITTELDMTKLLVGAVTRPILYVGTGQLLSDNDVSTTSIQSVYGLLDDPSITGAGPVIASPTRNNLVQQTFVSTSSTNRTLSTNAVNYTGTSAKSGWYVDLPAGERVNTNPYIALGALLVTTNIPSTTSCIPGGSSWYNVFDYKTGGVVTGSTWDYSSISLGNALASRPVVIKLPGGTAKALIRTSDAKTLVKDVPVSSSSAGSRRVSWREVTE